MGKLYDEIDDGLRAFLEAQHVFFVATAPSDGDGHVNCSPKGLDAFRVLAPRTVGYLDYVGSGVETIAHVRENGRIVLMFCAFEGPPRIVRLHGRGRVTEATDPGFDAASGPFPRRADVNVRAVVHVDVTRIADSCGYGVPLYRYEGERTQLPAWAERKGAEGIAEYKRERNATSIDGLGGLGAARNARR
jgi:predicted pyridoxine 5'-phosphate oxidase superfamily flavin-nucleotide-binding protein